MSSSSVRPSVRHSRNDMLHFSKDAATAAEVSALRFSPAIGHYFLSPQTRDSEQITQGDNHTERLHKFRNLGSGPSLPENDPPNFPLSSSFLSSLPSFHRVCMSIICGWSLGSLTNLLGKLADQVRPRSIWRGDAHPA